MTGRDPDDDAGTEGTAPDQASSADADADADAGADADAAAPVARFRAPAAGRADKLVAAGLGGASRKRVAALFQAGAVRVDGRRVQKGAAVAQGSEIAVADAPVTDDALRPIARPDLDLDVVYEDDALVIINKPALQPCQPLRAGESKTLASALIARYPECARVGADPREAGLAHRLDIATSGLVIAARSALVWGSLRHSFGNHAVEKRYLALTWGAPRGDQCAAPLRRQSGKRMAATTLDVHPRALPALTRWRVREALGPATLVECVTETGRMHQVRVHLAACGAPIVGDDTYGPDPAKAPVLPLRGHFLHASQLTLPHPISGRPLTVTAPLPADRSATLAHLRQRG